MLCIYKQSLRGSSTNTNSQPQANQVASSQQGREAHCSDFLDQHGSRFIFLFNSQKGPAELSIAQVLVSFHPCGIFFPSLMKESGELAVLGPPPGRGCPGDAWLQGFESGPSFQLSLRLSPVFPLLPPPTQHPPPGNVCSAAAGPELELMCLSLQTKNKPVCFMDVF